MCKIHYTQSGPISNLFGAPEWLRIDQAVAIMGLCGSSKDFPRTLMDFFRTWTLAPKFNHIRKVSIFADTASW